MAVFLLETDSITSSNSSLNSLVSQLSSLSSTISGYDVSDDTGAGFDFAGAKSKIASNVTACSTKIQNTIKLVEKVIEEHTNLQNSFKYDIPGADGGTPDGADTDTGTPQGTDQDSGKDTDGGGNYYGGGGGAGAAALAHPVRRGIGEHLDNCVIARGFHAPLEDIALVGVRRPVVGDLPVIINSIAGHIGICSRDVVMRGIVAAADIEAADIETQTVVTVECIRCLLCKRIGIADAVCPPAK